MAHNTLGLDLFLVGAGAIVFAAYLLYGHWLIVKKPEMKDDVNRGFGAALLVVGLMSLILAIEMFFEPFLPAWALELYGTGIGIYSILLLVGGFTIYTGSSLRAASYLAALGGLLMFQEANIINMFGLSQTPIATVALFALGGLVGLSTLLVTHLSSGQKAIGWPSVLTAVLAILFGLLSLYIGFNAIFGHVASSLVTP